jgi:hypothetical protein
MKSLFLCLISTICVAAGATELKPTGAGIEISAGSLGSFILTYPEFEPAHKQIEVKAASWWAVRWRAWLRKLQTLTAWW